ncbi:hypothetical protein SAMN06265784_102220 [Paraburkholderia susongensis]|uniref:Uncharacterized protein n=1 Tax=Paraburkholderia susongensis TaxID=1515439 RepID=A0A1X7J4T2_9BURK|nr:hypothetical protein SAMN06265784_102220 [Paraburkholderia susongensis]
MISSPLLWDAMIEAAQLTRNLLAELGLGVTTELSVPF